MKLIRQVRPERRTESWNRDEALSIYSRLLTALLDASRQERKLSRRSICSFKSAIERLFCLNLTKKSYIIGSVVCWRNQGYKATHNLLVSDGVVRQKSMDRWAKSSAGGFNIHKNCAFAASTLRCQHRSQICCCSVSQLPPRKQHRQAGDRKTSILPVYMIAGRCRLLSIECGRTWSFGFLLVNLKPARDQVYTILNRYIYQPCWRSPFLLGFRSLSHVSIGVIWVFVCGSKVDLTLFPPLENSSCFSLNLQLHLRMRWLSRMNVGRRRNLENHLQVRSCKRNYKELTWSFSRRASQSFSSNNFLVSE